MAWIEVRLAPDGSLSLNGMSSPETWNGLIRLLRNPKEPFSVEERTGEHSS